jgi:hypothetical protein
VGYSGFRIFDTQGCGLGPVFRDDFESGDVLAWSGEHAISWWPGDGNADDAIGTNHGTLHGGAGFTAGAVGQAFSFDGVDDYVSIPDDPSLDLGTGDLSVAFWLRTQSYDGSILKKGDHYNYRGGFDVGLLTYGQLTLRLWSQVGWEGDFTVPMAIAHGSFYHVAFTVDRDGDSGARAYIDGVLVQTFDPSIYGLGPITNSEDLLIGWDGGVGFFEGAVDEVMLFRRVITADEVAALAASR